MATAPTVEGDGFGDAGVEAGVECPGEVEPARHGVPLLLVDVDTPEDDARKRQGTSIVPEQLNL